MTTIISLPVEVLGKILCECSDKAIFQTCKAIAAVAFSTSALWTCIYLGPRQLLTPDGLDFLRAQIVRANGALLRVYVSVGGIREQTAEISAVCGVLEEYSGQIRKFKLIAHTAILVGSFVHAVFPNFKTFPALQVLSLLSGTESTGNPLDAVWQQLNLVNVNMMFPSLRELHINSCHGIVPIQPISASVSNLTGLILNGSLEDDIPSARPLATILHCTPQLETLWVKYYFLEDDETVRPSITQSMVKGQSLDIKLPRLKHLAVSVPGPASNLMRCITAPMLEDLHLDGARDSTWDEWADWERDSVYDALKLLALHSQNVQWLTLRDAYLKQTAWEWIMCGEDGRQPPFQKLKYITLHGVSGTMSSPWGFNNQLLEKFASKPMIPLKRLTLEDCEFPLDASAVVEAFRASGAEEFKYNNDTPQGMEDHSWKLEELGVSVTYVKTLDQYELPEWWTTMY